MYVMWLQEISDLRTTLNSEVDALRSEFMDLKAALKTQLGEHMHRCVSQFEHY